MNAVPDAPAQLDPARFPVRTWGMAPRCYLACPAYPLRDQAQRQTAVAAALAVTAELGWELEPSPLLDRHPGTGAWLPVPERLADLERGLDAEVLWLARGGHGCLHLIDALLARAAQAPLLIGFSDATVFHACWQRRGWGESLHGLMPAVPHGALARASLLALARGQALAWSPANQPDVRVVRGGTASGPCFAACASVLSALVGGAAMPELAGRILALEDIDEAPYRIDRCCEQLHRSGGLRGVVGIVAGRFPWQSPAGYAGPSHTDVLRAWCDRLGVPGIVGLPFGHDPDPLCLAVGRPAELRCGSDDWSFGFEARS